MKNLNKKAILVLVGVLFLAGCSFTEIGQKMDEGVEYIGDKYTEEEKEQAKGLFDSAKEKGKETLDLLIDDLSGFQMKQIDEWLEEENLNEFGDAVGTIYTGGTPLFDEVTGSKTERYDYIIDKHPELIDLFGLPAAK